VSVALLARGGAVDGGGLGPGGRESRRWCSRRVAPEGMWWVVESGAGMVGGWGFGGGELTGLRLGVVGVWWLVCSAGGGGGGWLGRGACGLGEVVGRGGENPGAEVKRRGRGAVGSVAGGMGGVGCGVVEGGMG